MSERPPIPCLRYARADLAITFLCEGLGFTAHAVHRDEADPTVIHHAQLTHGGGMVMLGTDRPGEAKSLYAWKLPEEAGGITMCTCLVVDDVDAVFAGAMAAGGEALTQPHANYGYPGRSFDLRDPGGHVWNVTDYDPWA